MSDPITIRASSWSDLFDCPARWAARQLEGKSLPSSGPAILGTALHASTAAFDQSRVDGSGLTVTDAVGVLVDHLKNPEQPVDWGESSPRHAEQIGVRLHVRYCREWSPRYEWQSVEMQCEPLDIEVNDVTIRLTGRMDRARVRSGGKGAGIVDLKSGARAVSKDGRAETKGHKLQIAVYELLAEHNGIDITETGEIVGLKTKGDPAIGRAEVSGTRQALLGSEHAPGAIEHAAQMLKSGTFIGNPRSALCSAKYCPAFAGCRWRD